MTPILTKYFFRRQALAIAVVWLALVALFLLFDVLQKADDHGMVRAFLISLLRLPVLAISSLPFACAIGATISIRRMITSGEMTALRTAGLSPLQLCRLNLTVILLLVGAYLFANEILLPTGSDLAETLEKNNYSTRALWLKDNDNYIRVNRLHIDGRMEDIVIYHTHDSTLRAVTIANSAKYLTDNWQLQNAQTQLIDPTAPAISDDWQLSVRPASFSVFFKKPHHMALSAITTAALELSAAGQTLHDLWEDLWLRVSILISLPLFVIISVWLINDDRRRRTTSVAVIIAAILPGLYFLCTKIFVQTALIFNAPILFFVPPVVLIAAVIQGIRRKNTV